MLRAEAKTRAPRLFLGLPFVSFAKLKLTRLSEYPKQAPGVFFCVILTATASRGRPSRAAPFRVWFRVLNLLRMSYLDLGTCLGGKLLMACPALGSLFGS